MSGKETGREDPRVIYADIINLPHWDSPVHPRMSMQERAAQFAPYAALVGYGDMVKEEARETGSRTEPGEDEAEELAAGFREIADLLAEGVQPVCSVSYFVPDARKAGGETVTVTEKIRRIDPVSQRIVLAKTQGVSGSYMEIDLDQVIRISLLPPFPAD